MTSLYPRHHGAISERRALPKGTTTLASILAEQSFATAAIVNSYYLKRNYGLARGFDHFEYVKELAGFDQLGYVKMIGPESSGVVDKAIMWLSHTKRSPFLLFLHDYHVHSDYSSLPRYERLFVRPYKGPVDGSNAQLLEVRRGGLKLNERDVAHLIDLYSAGVRQVDDDLGRLFEFLKETGLWKDTLIIVLSDHGEEFLEHGGVLHGHTQYEEILRIPLILSGPGIPKDRRVSESVSILDVAPTILAILGIHAPSDYEGVDLSSYWEPGFEPLDRDRVLFSEADHNNEIPNMLRSVRFQNYKLVANRRSGESVLFDLAKDPKETRDIAKENVAMARKLSAELKRFEGGMVQGTTLPPLDPKTKKQLEVLGYVR